MTLIWSGYMVYHMSTSAKTTVYLDGNDYESLKRLARLRGQSAAMLVREAVARYVANPSGGAGPASIGTGRSGRADLSDRAESLLEGMGRRK